MSPTTTLRPITLEDAEFLSLLYTTTRADEMALVDWTDVQKAEFLQQQFDAQHTYYQAQFPDAAYDIALLPEHRGGGLGTAILKEIVAEGASVGKLVRIHVEQFNPAMRLYERLGFEKIKEQGVYHLMEWTPGMESPRKTARRMDESRAIAGRRFFEVSEPDLSSPRCEGRSPRGRAHPGQRHDSRRRRPR